MSNVWRDSISINRKYKKTTIIIRVNVDINFTENTDGTINPQIEINIDGNQNNRENAAGLIQRSVSSRLRNIHPDL